MGLFLVGFVPCVLLMCFYQSKQPPYLEKVTPPAQDDKGAQSDEEEEEATSKSDDEGGEPLPSRKNKRRGSKSTQSKSEIKSLFQ